MSDKSVISDKPNDKSCAICCNPILHDSNMAPCCKQCKNNTCIDCFIRCETCPFCRLSHLGWFQKILQCKNAFQVQRFYQLYFEREHTSQNKFNEILARFVHFASDSPDNPGTFDIVSDISSQAESLIHASDTEEDVLQVLFVCRDWVFYCAQILKDEETMLSGIYLIEAIREKIAGSSVLESFALDVEQLFDILDEEEEEDCEGCEHENNRHRRRRTLSTFRATKLKQQQQRRRRQNMNNWQCHKSRNGIRRQRK